MSKPKVAIEPIYTHAQADASIELFTCDAVLAKANSSISGRIRVEYECLPSAGDVVSYFETDEVPYSLIGVLFESGTCELRFERFGKEQVAELSILSSRHSRDQPSQLKGRFNDAIICGSERPDTLQFNLFSFPDIFGGHLTSAPDAMGGWIGLLEFTDGLIDVRIDKLREPPKRMRGQLGISHTGTIRKSNCEKFTDDEIATSVTHLFKFLSFCRGAWTAPQLVVGLSDGEVCWQDLKSARYARKVQPGNWLHVQAPEAFQSFGDFREAMDDGLHGDALWSIIYWYIQASISGLGLETCIVVGQAALEALSFSTLVERRHVLSESGFQRLPAADIIRLLVNDCKIAPSIPPHYKGLMDFAKEFNLRDGPDCITSIRNALVHPSAKNRQRVDRLGVNGKYELVRIALKYIELGILNWIGYDGRYFDRFDPGEWAPGKLEHVPWAVST